MLFKLKILIIGFFFLAIHVRAESEPKEESPHQSSSGSASTSESQYSGKQSQEWSEIQTKLTSLKGKVDAQQAVVEAMIIEKEHLRGAELTNKIDMLKIEHQKLQKQITEYNELNKTYQTKFPEKGVKELRIYKRIDPQSIEHIEKDMTLDGRLTRLYQKVIKQYSRDTKKTDTHQTQKKPIEHSQKKTEETPSKSNNSDNVTDQIILQK